MENVRTINLNTEPAKKGVEELKKELKELKDTLVSTEQGTKEYSAALQRAAEIQHTLKETTEEINANALDFGQITQNTTKALGGLVSGFQAATAIMNLMGVENEDVIKSMQKMQSLMALTQSFSGIEAGVKAFGRLGSVIKGTVSGLNGLKAALVSTGIGAAVVAVGLLAQNWDKVSEALKRWGIINEDTKKKLEEQKTKIENLKTELVLLENKYQDYERSLKVSKLNKKAKDSYDELSESIKGYEMQLDIIINKQGQTNDKAEWEELNKQGLELQNSLKQAKDLQDAILKNEDNFKTIQQNTEDAAAQELANYRKIENEKLDIELERLKRQGLSEEEAINKQIDIENKRLKLLDEGTLAYEQQLTKIATLQKSLETAPEKRDFSQEQENLKTYSDIQLAQLTETFNKSLIKEEEYNQKKKEIQKEYLNSYIESLKEELESTELNAEARLEVEKKLAEAKAELAGLNITPTEEEESPEQKIIKSIGEIQKSLEDLGVSDAWINFAANIQNLISLFGELREKIQNGGAVWNDWAQLAGASFSVVGTLLGELASEQDKTNKEGFEKAKKMQIASATIQMLAGITTAIAGAFTAKSGPWDYALAAIQAATIAAVGGTQIAKIAQMKYNSGSSASVNTSALSSINAPVQYTQDVQGASIESSIQNQKVYVLESDITNTQNKVNVAESEAVF